MNCISKMPRRGPPHPGGHGLVRRAALLGLALLVAGCGRGPDDAAEAASRARAALDGGDVPAAAALVQGGLARWPEDPRLRELQGDLDLRGGRGDLAEAAYRKALRLAPERRDLAVKLARSVLQQGRAQDALALAIPGDADPPGVQAGLRVARLEAQLALPNGDLRAVQAEAQSLWRGTADAADAGVQAAAARLADLARQFPVVAAAREHARCRPAGLLGDGPVAEGTGPVMRVGPGRPLKRPSDAAAAAPDGAVVEIEAGTYDDVAVWTQDGLVLRGVGGRPRLRGAGRTAEDKGIWVIKGDRTTVENLEFSGARSSHRNGAGIRLEGSHLVVRRALFAGNQMGILTTNDTPDSDILISRAEFRDNVSGDTEGELGHNIYIGRAGRFTLEFSYVHGAAHGHNVKSRARVTRILYNRIADEARGSSSYLIDVPEGGQAEIIGNELHKGAFAENQPVIAYGAEAFRHRHADSAVRVAWNTFYNVSFEAIALKLGTEAPVMLVNNIFAGAPMASLVGGGATDRNAVLTGGLVDAAAYDYRLTPDSPAVDAAVDRTGAGEAVPPAAFEYVHPLGGRPREPVWRPDAGAHEFCAQATAGATPEQP